MKADKTWRLGLIGWPLGHSLSPALHASALAALSLPGEYRLYPVAPEHVQLEFNALLADLREGRLDGLNVTVPHKRAILPFLERLSPAAQSVDAVNTILLKDGLLTGDNTDVGGFARDLAGFEALDPSAKNKRALVLGAGGAARSVVYVLLQAGWAVTVAARSLIQAAALARGFSRLSQQLFTITLDKNMIRQPFDLIVNTTPVGMVPEIDQTPWPTGLPFPPDAALYDLIYNPPETLLMKSAVHSRNGLGMLVEQAALSFELWTGLPAPRAEMMRAAQAQLAAFDSQP